MTRQLLEDLESEASGMATNHKAGVCIINDMIYINNKYIQPPPMRNAKNITIINDKIFMNGFEYKNGRWERTLRALWHLLF